MVWPKAWAALITLSIYPSIVSGFSSFSHHRWVPAEEWHATTGPASVLRQWLAGNCVGFSHVMRGRQVFQFLVVAPCRRWCHCSHTAKPNKVVIRLLSEAPLQKAVFEKPFWYYWFWLSSVPVGGRRVVSNKQGGLMWISALKLGKDGLDLFLLQFFFVFFNAAI